MTNKSIKYRLYPTIEQEVMFAKTFGCCRKIYNLMLEDRINSYKETKSFGKQTPAMYKATYPYLKEVDSLALANVQLNLQKAFKNCFDKKRKTNNGFPKYKSAKHSRKSYTTNNQNGTVAIIDDKYIKFPKIGKVKVKLHRLPKTDWKIKSATISQTTDGKYYVAVLFEFENDAPTHTIDINNSIGLDYASDGLFIDSNGNVGSNHKFYRKSHEKLAKTQRKLSRMIESNITGYKIIGNKRYPIYKKDISECKNIQKQRLKIAKISRHIANQRLDNLHKLSAEIANQYDVVCVESLNMKAIANKGFGKGKATLDNGYGLFLNMLEYKLADRNKIFVKIDKWFPSSQMCHSCKTLHPEMKNLKIRTMECDCGVKINRDQNAAINILNEGLRILVQKAS